MSLLHRDAGPVSPLPAFETVRTAGEVDGVHGIHAKADAAFATPAAENDLALAPIITVGRSAILRRITSGELR